MRSKKAKRLRREAAEEAEPSTLQWVRQSNVRPGLTLEHEGARKVYQQLKRRKKNDKSTD